jgi:starch synthase
MKRNGPLEICMAASEALPYAKSGGLADVLGALPKAISAQGCRVHLFLPFYRTVREKYPDLEECLPDITLTLGGSDFSVGLLRHRPSPGVTVYLLRQDSLYDREGLYGDGEVGFRDNLLRFSLMCRAVLAALPALGLRPDLFHLHDWQAALLPLYLRHRRDLCPDLGEVPSLFTIHNLAYQGVFPSQGLDVAGIPEDLFHMDGVEFYDKLNLLKGGILYADAVTTVSRKYSREIQTPEYGAGLEEVLRKRGPDLHGILNGVDYDLWDPSRDPHLAANYSRENLGGKEVCKKDLLRAFGLSPDPEPPLMVTISRLVDQKGFDLVASALPSLLGLGFRYILLGTGERRYQDLFRDLASRYPDRMAIKIAYDEPLAHRIEAGADFYLMPSRFEPCGLNQIYSLRYGTIPLVRATGGLDDTIENYNPGTGQGTGLKFVDFSADALLAKGHEALLVYGRPEHRRQLIDNAMAANFSWESSARQYIDLYRRLPGSPRE